MSRRHKLSPPAPPFVDEEDAPEVAAEPAEVEVEGTRADARANGPWTDDGSEDEGIPYEDELPDESFQLLSRVAARTKGGGRVMINCPSVRLARSVGGVLILDFADDCLRAQVEFDSEEEANEIVEAMATVLAGPISWEDLPDSESADSAPADPAAEPSLATSSSTPTPALAAPATDEGIAQLMASAKNGSGKPN